METLDRSFFAYLRDQLAYVIGPIAQVIIDDAVEDLGYDYIYFPYDEADMLVEWVSREIPREEKKKVFESAMAEKIATGDIASPLPPWVKQ
jgi:hypothetical protein